MNRTSWICNLITIWVLVFLCRNCGTFNKLFLHTSVATISSFSDVPWGYLGGGDGRLMSAQLVTCYLYKISNQQFFSGNKYPVLFTMGRYEPSYLFTRLRTPTIFLHSFQLGWMLYRYTHIGPFSHQLMQRTLILGGRITIWLVSSLTRLDSTASLHRYNWNQKISLVKSKLFKLMTSHTVIFPLQWVFSN